MSLRASSLSLQHFPIISGAQNHHQSFNFTNCSTSSIIRLQKLSNSKVRPDRKSSASTTSHSNTSKCAPPTFLNSSSSSSASPSPSASQNAPPSLRSKTTLPTPSAELPSP